MDERWRLIWRRGDERGQLLVPCDHMLGREEHEVLSVPPRNRGIVPDHWAQQVKPAVAVRFEQSRPVCRPLLVYMVDAALSSNSRREEHDGRQGDEIGNEGPGALRREMFCYFKAHRDIKAPLCLDRSSEIGAPEPIGWDLQ